MRAFAAEIAAIAARVPGRIVSSIFFGGGTPSLMQPADVAPSWTRSRDTGASRPMPRSRSKPIRPASKPRAFAATARRASTACRSACRRSTIACSPNSGGRTRRAKRSTPCHRAERFRAHLVRSDLCAAAADAEGLGEGIEAALAEAGEHLSLYQLTVEPDTPFAALHAAGKLKTPDDDTARALYDTTQEVCAAYGLPAYEISNHARPGANAGTI